jgi:hypothetical protein
MSRNPIYGPGNPHPLSAMKTELIWEGKYDEYGNRREVHKSGDRQLGPGFFELAEELGSDTSDILRCWIEELKKVHAYWSNTD